MKYYITVFLLSMTSLTSNCQKPLILNAFFAKEYMKEAALYNAKIFLIQQVLGMTDEVVKFEIDPLAATTSGELTSLAYKCDSKSKEGLILGFYGTQSNDDGNNYQQYAFLNLPLDKARTILNKISAVIDANHQFITDDPDASNVYFLIDDITFFYFPIDF
jgi:hypothetical protein